jgi:hypothetical protein
MRIAARFLAVVALLLFASPVRALPPDVEKLYNDAKKDLQEARFFPALEKFKRSLTLVKGDPESEWQMTLAIALTYEEMDQLDHAIEYYRRFLEATGPRRASLSDKWRKRRKVATDTVQKREREVLQVRGRVDFASKPSGALVKVDGRAIGADGRAITPFTAYLQPGHRTVTMGLKGHEPGKERIHVVPGARETVAIPLRVVERKGTLLVKTGKNDAEVWADGKKVGVGPEVTLSLEQGTRVIDVRHKGKSIFRKKINVVQGLARVVEVDKKLVTAAKPVAKGKTPVVGGDAVESGGTPIWPWIAIGTGVAAGGGGALFTVKAMGYSQDIEDLDKNLGPVEGPKQYNGLKSDLESARTVSYILYGVAGAAIATGVVGLVLSGGDDAPAEARGPSYAPAVVSVTPFGDGAFVGAAWVY